MAWISFWYRKRHLEVLQDHPSPVKPLSFTRNFLCLIVDYLLGLDFLKMKHKSPSPPLYIPKLTLADFQSLLRSENKKRDDERRHERNVMEEERKLERAEDLRKLQVLLGLPP